MISLLARFFCKSDGKSPAQLRTAYGILCGAVGIGLNLLLFLGKFFAGTPTVSFCIEYTFTGTGSSACLF